MVGNSCAVIPNNDQARFASRGRCDLAVDNGHRVRFRRIGKMMGMEGLSLDDLRELEL